MTGTLTYTGTTGAGQALTAAVFNNVSDVDYQLDKGVLKVTYQNSGEPSRIIYLDLSASVTITMTIAGSAVTVTVST